jgi:hypothetical protein
MGVPGGQHSEYMLHRQPSSSDDGLASEDFRVLCDSFEQFGFVHNDRFENGLQSSI